jgi:hypothetical protein
MRSCAKERVAQHKNGTNVRTKLVVSKGIMCEKLRGTRSYDLYFKIMVTAHAEQTNNCEAAGKPQSLHKVYSMLETTKSELI